MGQYYKPIILKDDTNEVEGWLYSHDFDNGLKLMEHSWMKNNFVRAVESLLLKTPKRIVWAGDYADEEDTGKSLYCSCEDSTNINRSNISDDVSVDEWININRYIVNHTKKEYVDKLEVPGGDDGWRVHPLPLLTCEGNGRGGGDYRGESELIGCWARDLISVESNLEEFKDYKELTFDLVYE